MLESLLKNTLSRCPHCHKSLPASVWKIGEPGGEQVVLRRDCPQHGSIETCISSDARFYWLSVGREAASGCCSGGGCCAGSSGDGGLDGTLGRNALDADAWGVQEKLSTCLALIEIVHSCNLSCPTCYADSPVTRAVDAVPLEDLKSRIQGVLDRKGRIEILQLSGGEPTLHPDFFELVEWCQEKPDIDYVLLNTNGVKIAKDAAFAEQLAKVFKKGKFQLYLQFDGVQEAGQRALRGADLRDLRAQCLERCGEAEIPVTLAMTVTPANLDFLWETVAAGLGQRHVRGVSFQPEFRSGRGEGEKRRLNTADIILNVVEQSRGALRFEDFTPLPCGDPNCATIGYLLRTPAGVRSISDFVDFASVQGFLQDRVRYSLEDLAQCGCESEPLGQILKQFELDESHAFRLFIKPFMDAGTWDEDRIDRCCTHVIRPDGMLDSFCRYYSGFVQ
jgi:7,8-dihydro-6-hydroxymethylpterin dimethyltransferase